MRGKSPTHVTAESCLRLDVATLTQNAAGQQGVVADGVLRWRREREQLGALCFKLDTAVPPTLTLAYTHQQSGQDYTVTVQLEKTHPHFGGVRWWFLCSQCDRRVGVLYMRKATFACRHCHSLTYESQRLRRYKRQERQAQKLYHKLGGDGNLWLYTRPPKPKWMRWSTYRSCISELENLVYLSFKGLEEHYAV